MTEAVETKPDVSAWQHFSEIHKVFGDMDGIISRDGLGSKSLDAKRQKVVDAVFDFWRGKTVGVRGYRSDGLFEAAGVVDEVHGFAKIQVGAPPRRYYLEVSRRKLVEFRKTERFQTGEESRIDTRSLIFR